MVTIYQLKPRFQQLLRPAVGALAQAGVTANQVTLGTCAVSVALGLALAQPGLPRAALALLPLWLLLRMAFNAIDGLLAREHGQATRLGALLNELTDAVSDAALALPLAVLAPFDPFWVAAFVATALLAEYAGALGPSVGASRRYDGPMGKSDRAFAVGAIGLWAALAPLPPQAAWLMPLLTLLAALTTVNRCRAALREAA